MKPDLGLGQDQRWKMSKTNIKKLTGRLKRSEFNALYFG